MSAIDEAQGLISKDSYLEVSLTSTGTYALSATGNKITRATGSFVTDGIKVGNTIYTDDPANLGPLTVTTVSALEIDVTEAVVNTAAATRVLTAFVKVSEVISMNTPAAVPAEIDMTHLRASVKLFRNGLRDEGSITGQMNFIANDQGQNILRLMAKESGARTCRVTIPAIDGFDGYQWSFPALGRGGQASIATDQRVTADFTLRVTGEPVESVLT